MEDEFLYLDAHLTKLTKRDEVERFKYYVKKRIYFYLDLLSKRDKDALNEYSMMLIKKIAKKLNSKLTKIYRYFRRRYETVEKYFEISKPPSKNIRSPYKASNNSDLSFLNDSPLPLPPQERTMIHLKRYLAMIPPKNIQELLAFKDLLQDRMKAQELDRMKAQELERFKKNVKNIKNTIAIRVPGYMSPSNYTRGMKETERHLRTVARKDMVKELKGKFSDMKKAEREKVRQAELEKEKVRLRQNREAKIVMKRLEAEAMEESATRKRESANRKKANADRKYKQALQSMSRMRLDIREREARKRKIKMAKRAQRKEAINKAVQEEQEKREKAIEKGFQKQKEREMIKKQEDERRNQTIYENLMKGKQMSSKDRQRAVEMAVEAAFKQGPNRRGRPAVDTQTMSRSPPRSARKPSSNPRIVYVRSNGRPLGVNTPGFTGSPIGNNKERMVVVRPSPEESYLNYLKRLSGLF